jgi:Ca2+-binding RTX toxin-like protein
MLELLEPRKLLSASLSSTGLLKVEGTAGPDMIDVHREQTHVIVNVNGHIDQFDADAVHRIQIFGYAGNDRLTEHNLNRPSEIFGGTGNDWMRGDAGNDVFWGGDGDDAMEGGPGADQFNGGSGFDLVTYEGRPTRVVVSMNGVADDGSPPTTTFPGEHDNVKKDIEALTGSQGNDTLYGNELNNRINGAGGNDLIWAGKGNDLLIGGPGEDELHGQDGNDTFQARDGSVDHLFGGGGHDRANKDPVDTTDSIEELFT